MFVRKYIKNCRSASVMPDQRAPPEHYLMNIFFLWRPVSDARKGPPLLPVYEKSKEKIRILLTPKNEDILDSIYSPTKKSVDIESLSILY